MEKGSSFGSSKSSFYFEHEPKSPIYPDTPKSGDSSASLESQLPPYEPWSRRTVVPLPKRKATTLLIFLVINLFSTLILYALVSRKLSNHVSRLHPPPPQKVALYSSAFPNDDPVCELCDCSATVPRANASLLQSGPVETADDMGSILHSRMLDVYCPHIYAHRESAVTQLRRYKYRPEELMTWNVSALVPGKPTLYMYTKTSATHGKTQEHRCQYLERHYDMISRHRAEVMAKGFVDGKHWDARQVLWIIVEDGPILDEDVASLLALQSVPFIYLAFGPTHRYGNAQLNGALTLIHSLSNEAEGNVLGHGPVLSADDDEEIHEDLLDLVWKVKKVGVWPMGNLGKGFEGPVWKDGKIVEWPTLGDKTRLFPIDWGAFTFRSELLGKAIQGPNFFPYDNNGGENDFLKKFVRGWDEIENVCRDPTNCHLAWHNQPIEISTLWLRGIPYPF